MAATLTVEELAARIPDGASLALAPDYSGCALAVVRALIRRGARELHLIGVPQLGFQADLLIGAGCVRSVEAAAVTLGEQGPAPRFVAAVKAGTIEIRDSTCPAIHAGLQAAEKGLPFLPLRGVLGSDLVRHRPDWRVIDNPFGEDDPILLVPAIRPDVALFHAALADRAGNVWIGVRRELMLMAHAARTTLVTVEEITERRPAGRRPHGRRHDPGALRHRDRGGATRRLAGRPAPALPRRSRPPAPLCGAGRGTRQASPAISTSSCSSGSPAE